MCVRVDRGGGGGGVLSLKVLSSSNAFQQLSESSLPGLLQTHTFTHRPVKRPLKQGL